jgi:hypothetical protein
MAPEPVEAGAASLQSRCRYGLGGLLVRKERWGLSWRGWMAVWGLVTVLWVVVFFGVHPFLAVSEPVRADFLVIEGWVPTYALEQGLAEFRAGGYKRLFTTGGPIAEGEQWSEHKTLAEAAAARLRALGAAPEVVEPVASVAVSRNRTYASALGVRRWFQERGLAVKAINVMTVGVHARRTRLMYEKAFGKHVAVGIIAVRNRSYDPRHWWESSEGAKEVILESIGYIYSRFFFRAPADAAVKPRQVSSGPCGVTREIRLTGVALWLVAAASQALLTLVLWPSRGKDQKLRFEARNPKSETNAKARNTEIRNARASWRLVCRLPVGDTAECHSALLGPGCPVAGQAPTATLAPWPELPAPEPLLFTRRPGPLPVEGRRGRARVGRAAPSVPPGRGEGSGEVRADAGHPPPASTSQAQAPCPEASYRRLAAAATFFSASSRRRLQMPHAPSPCSGPSSVLCLLSSGVAVGADGAYQPPHGGGHVHDWGLVGFRGNFGL